MKRFTLATCALSIAALTAPASAQNFQFTIDPSLSNYNWSGTTSVGTLVGNPSTAFQLQGTVELDLNSGGAPVGSGQWVSSDALVVPNLSGIIPNPIPLFPPLATISVAGMRFSITSNNFAVNGAGAFSTTSVLTVTAGILTVTPLVGAQTMTNLAGTLGPPSPTSGTINMAGNVMTFVSPMATNFMFTDPTSGISATINLNGTLTANYVCQPGTNYCTFSPNSVGPGSQISGTGSTSITANTFGLIAPGCVPGMPGLFFTSGTQGGAPLGNGTLCLSGAIVRFPVVVASPAGTYTQPLNFSGLPLGLFVSAGDNRNFQCWYRDPAAGGAGFNLSDGVNVTFCP